MNSQTLTIRSHDGAQFAVFLAQPEASKAPGLLLIQYICGVNKVMRELAGEFAQQGYLTIVPDLFWRQEPGVQLIQDPSRPDKEEFQRALALNDGFDDELGTRDLISTLQFLRRHEGCSGRAGALGYCLGGRMAYYMATRSDADCCVSYYGVNIHQHLDEAGRIRRPLLLHIAEQDQLVPPPAREAIVARLQKIPQVSISVHPRVNHAFALPGGQAYDATAAERANRESLQFLNSHLILS